MSIRKINLKDNKLFYEDFAAGLQYLNNVNFDDYEYPKERMKFHVYTEAKTEKQLESIKSYLATQDLDNTELIVWCDYDITNQANMQPYKDLVTIKVYNPIEEAKGTPIEGKMNLLKPQDTDRHWMTSGVFRFLVTYKYGGIYYDMDIVLLRDFKPLLKLDFCYQWGSSTNFGKIQGMGELMGPCAAMVGGVKGSEFMKNCIEQVGMTTVQPNSHCFDEEMMSHVYRRNPNCFTIFPSTWFNTEWLIGRTDIDLSRNVQAGWFTNNNIGGKHLFLDAFAWHWHNTSNGKKEVEVGSKFYELQQLTNSRLKERGIAYE